VRFDQPLYSFTTARIDHEDGTAGFFLQASRLVTVEPLPKSTYERNFTYFFYFVPTDDESLALHYPGGREITFDTTDKPLVRSQAESEEILSSISDFAALTSDYSRLKSDDSGERFRDGLTASLMLGGLAVACIAGIPAARNASKGVRDVIVFFAVGSGLLAVPATLQTIGDFRDHRRNLKELGGITARLEEMTSRFE
jgi:hypothetical protein